MAKLHILLAEDNLINQRVAVGTLAALGYQTTVVNNGRDAVTALQRQPFDVVLMDLHMPDLDGLQATAAIRKHEQEHGLARRTPIIALTAGALAGDRERCLAAGMDGYVAKPIQREELQRALEQVLAAPTPDSDPRERRPDDAVLDRQTLLQRVGNNRQVLLEIVELFPGECARLLCALQAGSDAQDVKQMQEAAHTLKGTLSSLTATAAADVAARVEQASHAGELGAVPATLARLREHLADVAAAVGELRRDLLNQATVVERNADDDHETHRHKRGRGGELAPGDGK